jgi:uroporphyrin-III C-methyltransferase / precorrin-2 dehydrogenase / sirohydrochlorin ferrochelatase
MPDLLPLFLNLTGRAVLLVGGGRVAEAKLRQLLAAGAQVRVVAPVITSAIRAANVELVERGFVAGDLEGAWLVVAAATPEVNREVAAAAEPRRVFVNAVDDPANASAFLSGVVRRDGVTIAVSTDGHAPALTALLREGLNALLPADLGAWMAVAREQRVQWRRGQVPMEERKPHLLRALNALYASGPAARTVDRAFDIAPRFSSAAAVADRDPGVPWLNGPEDSWL